MATEPIKILFFDTGNYSRSPAAEVMAKAIALRAGASHRFEFASAGMTDTHVGDEADPRTKLACDEMGYDLAGFRCAQADASIFAAYDQILAMDKNNLAALRLARRDGDKAEISLLDPDREIPDPYHGDQDGFRKVMDMIERRVKEIVESD